MNENVMTNANKAFNRCKKYQECGCGRTFSLFVHLENMDNIIIRGYCGYCETHTSVVIPLKEIEFIFEYLAKLLFTLKAAPHRLAHPPIGDVRRAMFDIDPVCLPSNHADVS